MHSRPVNSMDNPNAERVKRVAQLAGRSAVRIRRQRFLAEGPQSASEALRAHLGLLDLSVEALKFWPPEQTVAEVYYTARLASTHPELMELITELDHGVFVAETTDRVLQAMSDAVVHQNIIVVANLPAARGVPSDEAALIAGLVRVQDPGNAGTIIRAADAAGADYVFTTPDTVDIYNPKAVRSTAGSLFHLPVYANVPLADFRTQYRGQILAADGYGDVGLDQTETGMLAQHTAWLFGNEARGLSGHDLEFADARVAVPLYGLAESLNVATAATICLYSSAMAQSGA
ncbi:RNA methyltransferase [Enteractinococcus fodinae]|uniref:TrmH family RNA methyltransferase n=2 Tax=Actinomycetes TaxID=1760 RepID=A0ABU2AZH0_9MICC|nr:RNA methyltransferase [Enteractinococcus fodinae]MDR7346745.1 TrmH family RNA methyltransferase [Enteractinococcus fodinae]